MLVGRLYEFGIRSENLNRVRLELFDEFNHRFYSLTTPKAKTPTIRIVGFPSVRIAVFKLFLLETIDELPPRHVRMFTKGCFHERSVEYATQTTLPMHRITSSE